ncbi:MAG: glycosyltransferase family 4 protein [Muribaculaceae bacterium]|nr:glycosyltransferase family 4 protein [Muribaculaceae bacterium]
MAGNYYKHHHPGGISAVIQYWESYIEDLQYYPTYRLSKIVVRLWYFLSSYVRMAWKMSFDRDVEIIHLHTAADGSFWRKVQLTKLAKFFHKKVILHVHASRFKDFYNGASEKKKKWIEEELKRVDKLVVLSESWQRWFESIGVISQKIEVLHNITAYPTKIPTAKIKDGKTHFLFMGEIGPRKGVFDILRGLSLHREELKDKIIFRIGGNRNEELLLKTIKDNGLDSFVHFDGWVSGQKKIELLNWADVFILPSFNEGLPISILEAMSYGMPIISTPVGGIPEVVHENGLLVSPGNEEEIIQAIRFFVEIPERIGLCGAYSLKIVNTYLPDYVMVHLLDIYRKLFK